MIRPQYRDIRYDMIYRAITNDYTYPKLEKVGFREIYWGFLPFCFQVIFSILLRQVG